jgi:hypothetical protein
MRLIFTSLIITGLLVGCGTKEKKEQPVTTIPSTNQLVLPMPNYAPSAGTMPNSNQVIIPQQNVIPSATSATTVTAAGMNPPHGQPGHRCDIAVGAPLNSAPKTNLSPGTTTTISQPVFTTTTTNTVKTALGMNPPHGQPGHQCGIPVGSPLNSKPTVAAATQTTPTIQTITNPPVIKTEAAETKVSANPVGAVAPDTSKKQ